MIARDLNPVMFLRNKPVNSILSPAEGDPGLHNMYTIPRLRAKHRSGTLGYAINGCQCKNCMTIVEKQNKQ
jgi:hypothetical protein